MIADHAGGMGEAERIAKRCRTALGLTTTIKPAAWAKQKASQDGAERPWLDAYE
jgi:hypothetical protein